MRLPSDPKRALFMFLALGKMIRYVDDSLLGQEPILFVGDSFVFRHGQYGAGAPLFADYMYWGQILQEQTKQKALVRCP